MGKQSVFERLARTFSECRKEEIDRDKVMSNGDVPSVLDTAGNAFFDAISSKQIHLGDIPPWFTIEPKGTSSHGGIRQSWDLYWLTAVEWLSQNKPDSGITFPGYILNSVSLQERLYSGCDIYDILYYWHRLSDKHFKKAWCQLAMASEEACLYLAQISKEPTASGVKAGLIRIWRMLKKIWKLVVGIVFFLSALFALLHYWPEIRQKLQSLHFH